MLRISAKGLFNTWYLWKQRKSKKISGDITFTRCPRVMSSLIFIKRAVEQDCQ
jgi:hypothetical protein